MLSLEQFSIIAPIESARGYRRVVSAARRQRIAPQKLLIVCLRDDLAPLLQAKATDIVVVGRAELPALKEVIKEANRDLASLENDFIAAAEQGDFLWAILFQFQNEYLLHLHTCRVVAEHLLKTFPGVSWLLTPGGWLWGNGADQFGLNTPVFYIVLRALLDQQRQRYNVVGFTLQRFVSLLHSVLAVRLLTNIILLGLFSMVSYGLGGLTAISRGFRKAEKSDVLAFFEEPFSFSSAARVTAALDTQGYSLHRVRWSNLLFVRRGSVLSDLYSMAKNCLALGQSDDRVSWLGRIDNRTQASRWFFVVVQSMRHFSGRECYRLWRKGWGEARLAWRQVQKMGHLDIGAAGPVSLYTRLIILNYLPEYWFSALTLKALLKQVRPTLVLYPDGYPMLIRLAQRWGKRYGYRTVQVPHGYPNRTFAQTYYWADHYLTPSQLSERQLLEVGRPASAMAWITNQTVRDWQAEVGRSQGVKPGSAIGIVYSGSCAYWSFPNMYDELWVVTRQLIAALRQALPATPIILKSHPNGTSPSFFAALQEIWPDDFKTKRIVHVARGWGSATDFRQLKVAMAPVIFPSTPTMQFLALGIPLLFVAGDTDIPAPNLYYPHHRHMTQYPLYFRDASVAVARAAHFMKDPGAYDEARKTMLGYSDRLLTPEAGTAVRPLAHVLGQWLTSSY